LDCNYLKECGSCTLFTPYDEQILFKTDLVKQNFSKFYDGEFDVFSSTPKHYRTRAEFGIWHEGSKLCYTMHASEKGKKVIQPPADAVEEMPQAHHARAQYDKGQSVQKRGILAFCRPAPAV